MTISRADRAQTPPPKKTKTNIISIYYVISFNVLVYMDLYLSLKNGTL